MTQKEIAKHLNISRSTVARAFNGGRINDETKNKILEFAEKVGYRPNNLAQTLVRKNKLSIFIGLVESISPTYVEEVINGIKFSEKKYLDYKLELNILKFKPDIENASFFQYEKLLEIINLYTPKVLIVSFIDSVYIEKIANLCIENDITLITLDTLSFKNFCHIGPNYEKMGALTADFLVTAMKEEGKILLLNYEDNCNINRRRVKGFLNFTNNYKNISVETINLNSLSQIDFDIALNQIKNNLHMYDSIYTSFNSENIINYLQRNFIPKKFYIVANDLDKNIEELLLKRRISCVIYQKPFYQGMILVDTIFNYLIKNNPLPSLIDIGIDVLFKENLAPTLYISY